jgi:tight adherence protein B
MVTIALLFCVFGFIATLVYFGASLLLDKEAQDPGERLDKLINGRRGSKIEETELSFLRDQAGPGGWTGSMLLKSFPGFEEYLRQSGVAVSVSGLVVMVIGLLVGGMAVHAMFFPFKYLFFVTGGFLAVLPLAYVAFRRKKRLAKYSEYLPDALSMMCNALKAGQSLNACFNLVADQAPAPLGPEFARCYEEQNLGIPLETALLEMAKRAPNVDLKFFATAVILQRQTGGDLCEILDKIARLIRERFQIHGMIMALTGEGRLSGAVLLALPPGLTIVMFFISPDYIMKLFTEPLGQQMLAGAAVSQVFGFLWIRKIINIKV